MIDNNRDAINNCISTFGIIEAINIFEYALPRIVQRKKELCGYIQAQDWLAAKQCAHQTISAVRLYGSDHLEQQLHQVKLLGTSDIDPTQFEQILAQAFDQAIQTVTEWLAQQKSV
jgi:hypothetical protein